MAFSKSTVSDLCLQLDPMEGAWNNRPLVDSRFLFILVDGMVVKIREEGRVHPRGMMIVQA
ncbi:transposase [Paenibacillus sp. E222]|nr:transposase [Paenibacillus sp. E222]